MSIAERFALHRLGPDDNGIRMTPEEFDAIDDWDRDYLFELVQGVLIVTPSPGVDERKPNDVLGHWILTYQESHPSGSCVDDTLPEQYLATSYGRRRADRVIWIGLGRDPNINKDIPQIAIEFVSEQRRDWHRDYCTKRDEYREIGVAEYWVIDRHDRSLTVFGPEGDQRLLEGDVLRTSLMPGFELSEDKLMATIDRYRSQIRK